MFVTVFTRAHFICLLSFAEIKYAYVCMYQKASLPLCRDVQLGPICGIFSAVVKL